MSGPVGFGIAGVTFALTSARPQEPRDAEDCLPRYAAFLRRAPAKPDIRISVAVTRTPPAPRGKRVFAVYEPASGFERWQLWEGRKDFLYLCPIPERRVTAVVAKDFSWARAYVPPYRGRLAWDVRDILYDLMQILLINYFAHRRSGLFLHAAGVKEKGHSLVFAGKSESGKSTTARLWHRHSRATVLNDDRIIVRKDARGYVAYSAPWHGEFGHVRPAVKDQAPLKALFILGHGRRNVCRRLLGAEAFRRLYPTLFSVFWSRRLLGNVLGLCEDLLDSVPVYRLGFVKNKSAVGFVRRIVDQAARL